MNVCDKPRCLKKGAIISVIAPSQPLNVISKENIQYGIRNVISLGFKVVFSESAMLPIDFPMRARFLAEDITSTISNDNIDGIMVAIGGYSSLEILDYLDFDCLKKKQNLLLDFLILRYLIVPF